MHYRQIPHQVRSFIDDSGVKGPKSTYDDEETSPGIRRFVYEHAQIFRQFMQDCWTAGLTISGPKSMIGMSGIDIVGFLCDKDGRKPVQSKVLKILDWPIPRNIKEARGFIGIVTYYKIFIPRLAVIAAPIYNLFRKGKRFVWNSECQLAMDTLKRRLTESPVLITLDLSPSALRIIVNVDAASTIGWGAVLSQYQSNGEIHPARYESGIWSDPEKKYDALKLECRGLLKALKKFRYWLFGRYFSVRTDSQSLVWLLNQPPNDLPNAMMTRWLAYLRLFDFDATHVPVTKNGAADALSRRGAAMEDDSEDDETDSYFEAKMYGIMVSVSNLVSVIQSSKALDVVARVYLHEGEYEGDDLLLGQYLETLRRPDELTDLQYQSLRRKAKNFLVRDGYLFKRGRKSGIPPRRVINRPER
ncbi:MAG: hypothetical protein E6H10_05305 [Bacteroidetes bacterium]|nr:MAG: hypothetical protein E6H10_05305 [Bacteroidota bacterium]